MPTWTTFAMISRRINQTYANGWLSWDIGMPLS